VIDEGQVRMAGPLGHFVGGPRGTLEDRYLDMVDGG
jgi:hypothetical protein